MLKITEETIVSLKMLSKIIDLSERQIQRLVKEDVIKKNENGKYLLLGSIHGYLEYVEAKNDADVDLKEEKIKEEIERIKKDTELKSIKISELKNQLHPAGIIEEVMTNMLMNMKGKLLSISNKLAPMIIAMDNLSEIQDTIQSEILETLEELSDYDSEMFKSKNYIDVEEEVEIESEQKRKRGKPKKSK